MQQWSATVGLCVRLYAADADTVAALRRQHLRPDGLGLGVRPSRFTGHCWQVCHSPLPLALSADLLVAQPVWLCSWATCLSSHVSVYDPGLSIHYAAMSGVFKGHNFVVRTAHASHSCGWEGQLSSYF